MMNSVLVPDFSLVNVVHFRPERMFFELVSLVPRLDMRGCTGEVAACKLPIEMVQGTWPPGALELILIQNT